MIDPFCGADDFDVLLSSYCDSMLSARELARLNLLLRSSPVLRRRYLHYMGVHAALGFLVGRYGHNGTDAESDFPLSPPTVETRRSRAHERTVSIRYFRSVCLAVCMILLIGATLASCMWWLSRRSSLTDARKLGRECREDLKRRREHVLTAIFVRQGPAVILRPVLIAWSRGLFRSCSGLGRRSSSWLQPSSNSIRQTASRYAGEY